RVRLLSQGTEVAGASTDQGHVRGASRRCGRSPDRRHGQGDRPVRGTPWFPLQGPGPSNPWPVDGEAMAEVSPRPWTPSRKADFENENSRELRPRIRNRAPETPSHSRGDNIPGMSLSIDALKSFVVLAE